MRFLSLTTLAVLTACSVCLAQQQDTDQDARQRRQIQPQRQLEQSAQRPTQQDQQFMEYFAGKLMLMNHCTIELSEVAAQKASAPQVKQFAQQLAEAHRDLDKKLRQFAPEVAKLAMVETSQRHRTGFRGTVNPFDSDGPQTTLNDDSVETSQDESETATKDSDEDVQIPNREFTAGRTTSLSADPLRRVLQIEREAVQIHVQSTRQMLQRYQGQDFDMAYLGFQIGGHAWAEAELTALKDVGDEKFQQIVADASGKIQQHLQQARQLAKQFEDKEHATTDRASRANIEDSNLNTPRR